MISVWRITGKIIRTAIINTYAQLYSAVLTILGLACFFFVFCVSVKVKLTVPLLCACVHSAWKGRPQNDLYCVGWDVKPCSLTHSEQEFNLMLTGRAKAYSSSCPQAVTHRSTNRAQRRVTSFQPKRVTNDATPPTPVPWRRIVNDFVLQSEIAQKIHKKSLLWRSRSSKVTEFSANQKPVYDFLLVINSNLGLISHRY